ncbi:MAG: RDD domain containing protein [candidate division WWE3 bacterium GW2011_GWF2_41_45]|nr:MAG: RDD domain containing protein [candidate division WWE3 bacterium GW2011_GWC2_41_23]KKS10636.1 MAG: RDD domain containing protein [candidate division WWE3 bacterium GW2011_GWF2_41_45]KKS12353.1 MAG: RDD domain containing protein [candidate division WWE3 bacterium GW2011_GWF1_41_53]KKS20427.1 MAG: RDD domain containing protein [candidate division WWE3 bacterium GW2011_GWE1_41_72]KKS28596.1 MAG: RDD domain containing protein [candidate division WWE3 bacterium GW2011_GWD2_42_11]KKS51183.1 
MDKYKTAGIVRRYFAYALDCLISMLVVLIPFLLVTFNAVKGYFASPSTWSALSVVLPFSILFLIPILMFFYSWYFTHKFGGTIGKLLFRLRIVDENGSYMDKTTAFWRMTAGYALSSSFFGLGYLWAFRKKEDLTWHDRFLSTRVIRVGSPVWGIIALILLKIVLITFIVYFVITLLLPLVGTNTQPFPIA